MKTIFIKKEDEYLEPCLSNLSENTKKVMAKRLLLLLFFSFSIGASIGLFIGLTVFK